MIGIDANAIVKHQLLKRINWIETTYGTEFTNKLYWWRIFETQHRSKLALKFDLRDWWLWWNSWSTNGSLFTIITVSGSSKMQRFRFNFNVHLNQFEIKIDISKIDSISYTLCWRHVHNFTPNISKWSKFKIIENDNEKTTKLHPKMVSKSRHRIKMLNVYSK